MRCLQHNLITQSRGQTVPQLYVLTEFLQFLVFTNVKKFLVVRILRKVGEKGAKDTYFGTSIRGGDVLRLRVPVGVDVAEAHEGSES